MNKTNYVRETIDLCKQIETRFLELSARLYKIKENRLWEGSYESYNEFLDVARISAGNASKLTSIYQYYVVDGGKDQKQLVGIGYSNLYEAIPLIERDGIDVAIVKADTLTRNEIQEEVRDERHGVHKHTLGDERWGKCEVCNKFERVL